MDEPRTELTLRNGETVELWASEFERIAESLPGLERLLAGDESAFPAFEARAVRRRPDTRFSGMTSEPGPDETELVADGRLYYFAHLTRPFAWVDDPRQDRLQELIGCSTSEAGRAEVKVSSTQDLWDALFLLARGERFVDGLFDSYAEELAVVGNEIRRRLIGAAG